MKFIIGTQTRQPHDKTPAQTQLFTVKTPRVQLTQSMGQKLCTLIKYLILMDMRSKHGLR